MRNRTALMLASRRAPAIVHMAAYANNLTGIIPDIFAAMDTVSREMVGFVPSAFRNTAVERAAVGQSVTYPTSGRKAAVDIVPAMTIPEPTDSTIGTGTMAITKARAVEFGFTGEEQRALNTGGIGYLTAQGMLISEALRELTNEVETDLAVEASTHASRAYGTPGTLPFTGDELDSSANMKRILDENGAPRTGRSLVLNSLTSAKLIAQKNLTRVNEAGTQMTLRQGEILDLHGFSIKDTFAAVQHTAGTGASSTTNNAGYAVGATVITLAATGTGTVKAGDVVTFAGDTNKYVVVAGDADVSNGGTITLGSPGLRVAIPAAATAITVVGSHGVNVGFAQNALHVAMRPPAKPVEGDQRLDEMLVTDPRSGITYEITVWPGYRKVRAEVGLAWGVKAVKPDHIALLLS